MTIGQKIQQLRKEKGMSQEQLAEVLNVSRQALSKWELGDSTPDVDKIILLSNYFQVSTDYLLKDDFQTEGQEKQKSNQRIPVIISTALVAIGLMVAWARASDGTMLIYWSFAQAMPGLMLQVIGVAAFEVLFFSRQLGVQHQYIFWAVNTWLLSLLPSIIFTAAYFNYRYGAYDFLRYIMVMGVVYLVFNVGVTIYCLYRKGRKQ